MEVCATSRPESWHVIVVGASVWVDHLRRGDALLAGLLDGNRVLMPPFVLGEIACGSLFRRDMILELRGRFPQATAAEADEILGCMDRHALHRKGLGKVDAHVLASSTLDNSKLRTSYRRLRVAARSLDLDFDSATGGWRVRRWIGAASATSARPAARAEPAG